MDIVLPPKIKERSDVARVFKHLADLLLTPPPPGADPIAFIRKNIERYGSLEPVAGITGVEVRPVSAGGVPAEWILPKGWKSGPSARLVYLHGGGWAAGSIDSHRPFAASLAKQLGYPVLLVGYSLAPEHPFPAALQDCAKVLSWARKFGPDGASQTHCLGLAGDSSGGNIAAATVVKVIEEGGEQPDRLLLLSASLDLSAQPGRLGIVDPMVDLSLQDPAFQGILALYVQGKTTAENPLVSPLRASDETLAQFPPTLLQVSSNEFLLWDAQQFAQRLVANGVRATLSVWPGMPHVWQLFQFLPESVEALGEAIAFLSAGVRKARGPWWRRRQP
jgi:epsilon-lactone hydrolase